MICVIVGGSVSVFFKNQVGKGSRLQDFVGEFLMIFNISWLAMCVNVDRPSPRELVIGDRTVWRSVKLIESSWERILVIFSVKKVQN